MNDFGDGIFTYVSCKDFPIRDRQIVEIDADANISVSLLGVLKQVEGEQLD